MINILPDPLNPARDSNHRGAAPDMGVARAPRDCRAYALAKFSGRVWWIEYYDHDKKLRRERIGPNKVAAMGFGPKKVILVVGLNKVAPDLETVMARVKHHAAPINAIRLSIKTYSPTGKFSKGIEWDKGGLTTWNSWRRHPDSNRRITVLQTAALPLGYAASGAGNGI